MPEKVGPTKLGKLVIFLFIVGLLVAAGYFFKDLIAPKGAGPGDVDLDAFRQETGKLEAPDTAGVTTVSEYSYVPAEKLPSVQGVS
ncbi:MAG: hypothetical protein KDD47_01450, partial [Acidobacteria bacterium]|nr:hypothetical protein [Acidobacteriota bacterium]